jgi:transposase
MVGRLKRIFKWGVADNLLRRWMDKYAEIDDATSNEELNRLRAENKRLRMERDILKKATAFFANEKN